MTLGARIKKLRADKKLSLRKLEQMTGLSRSTLSEIESGSIKNPTIATLSKIAQALKIPISDLVGEAYASDGEREEEASGARPGAENRIRQDFLDSVERAKRCSAETIDKITSFIDFMLERESKRR